MFKCRVASRRVVSRRRATIVRPALARIRPTRLRKSSFTCIILMELLWPDVLCSADADPAHPAVGNVPVHKCIVPQIGARSQIKWQKAQFQFSGFE